MSALGFGIWIWVDMWQNDVIIIKLKKSKFSPIAICSHHDILHFLSSVVHAVCRLVDCIAVKCMHEAESAMRAFMGSVFFLQPAATHNIIIKLHLQSYRTYETISLVIRKIYLCKLLGRILRFVHPEKLRSSRQLNSPDIVEAFVNCNNP